MASVLVLSCYEDEAARMVVDKLRAYPVDTVWFDTADFPLAADLAAFPGSSALGTLKTRNGVVNLDDVVSVLYRRPAQFQMPPDMADEHRVFARVEARQGFGGVLTGIEARWVNHPSAIATGNFKPKQLDVAAAVGMNVPRTLVTNSPEQAQKFAYDVGRTLIYKVFEPPTLSDQKVIFTSVVDPGEFNDPSIGLTAHLFQEQIPKEFDARITVIGGACFGVAIHAESPAARIDFRADYGSVTYRSLPLPGDLPRQLRAYLDRFGLAFGAFDFAVTADGEYYFLECNPNGQWGWLEDETGLPMAEAFAKYLAEG
ncbi:MAG: MvdC/MvdD family ATP grasp protein [Haloechinothrix sp.]